MRGARGKAERSERDLLWAFDLALIIKAVDGALEMLGALLMLLVRPRLVERIVEFVTAREIANDPDDVIATHLRATAHAYALHPHTLIAAYLALHGAVKVALVAGILRGHKNAYPAFVVVQSILSAYEAYRGIELNSFLLLALAAIDFAVLVLAAYEYRRRYPSAPLTLRPGTPQ